MSTLSLFKKNVHSQNGEDGVVEEILRRLDIATGAFVEFGAWDGKHLSNTYHLLEQGWRGLYIEGDADRYRQLVINMHPYSERVELMHAYVQPAGTNTLDDLLASSKIERDFEVLSIDVDSFDWYIWESLRNYRPLVVIIEINSSIPVGIYQTHRGDQIRGSSFTATVDLAARKGYTPVCHTGNLICVRRDSVARLKLPETEILFPETLFDYSWKSLTYEAHSLPGQAFLSRIRTTLKKLAGGSVDRDSA